MAQLTKEYFDEQIEKLAQITAKGFAQTATKQDIQALDKRIAALEARMAKLEQEMQALSGKVTNYLQLSDKRYLELKRRDMVIAKWLKQVADKTGVEIDLAELERF